jgi:hypothetical protein
MSQPQVYSLWILLEGHPQPSRLDDITFSLRRDADLSDLAPYLISKRNELASKCPDDLEFFNYDNRTKSLPRDTLLKTVEQDTSAGKPLVVRYPLLDNTSRSFFLAHIVYVRAVRLSHFLFLPPVYSRCQSQVPQFSSRNSPPLHHWHLVHAPYRNQKEV